MPELNASLKRLVVAGLTVAFLALHKRFGIEIDATAQAAIAGIVMAFLAQSGLVAAKKAGAEAAAKVTTLEDAAAELSKPGQP